MADPKTNKPPTSIILWTAMIHIKTDRLSASELEVEWERMRWLPTISSLKQEFPPTKSYESMTDQSGIKKQYMKKVLGAHGLQKNVFFSTWLNACECLVVYDSSYDHWFELFDDSDTNWCRKWWAENVTGDVFFGCHPVTVAISELIMFCGRNWLVLFAHV